MASGDSSLGHRKRLRDRFLRGGLSGFHDYEIVDIEDIFGGDTSSVAINFRNIQENAIQSKASGIIFVHNHPSGNPTPSGTDHQLTRDLVFMGIIL